MWTKRVLVAAALTLSSAALAAHQQAVDSRTGFERLKRLVGTWSVAVDGRSGSQVATYRMTGGGRVLTEDMGGMMTTYHLDVDRLVMTHFCGAGNQPRMRVTELDDRHIAFEMYDITNLADPKAYHSTHLDVLFLDENRVELAYRGITDGRVSTQVFRLTRNRS